MIPEAADELFALDPAEFTKARDALAKAVKAGGDKEGAAAVKALRRPTAAAWAVNRLARERRGRVEELVRAGERVRKAAAGGPDSLREAMGARRKLVSALVEEALDVAGRAAGTQRDAIAATLEAASLDPDAGAAVLEARLTKDLEPPTDFGLDIVVGPKSRPAPRPSPAASDAADAADGERGEGAEVAGGGGGQRGAGGGGGEGGPDASGGAAGAVATDEAVEEEPPGPDPRALAQARSELRRREQAAERARAEAERAAHELDRARRHLDHLELKASRAAADADEADTELAEARSALDALNS